MDRIQYISKTISGLNLSESEATQSFDADMAAYDILHTIADRSHIVCTERSYSENGCDSSIDVSCNNEGELKSLAENIQETRVYKKYDTEHTVTVDLEKDKLRLTISSKR